MKVLSREVVQETEQKYLPPKILTISNQNPEGREGDMGETDENMVGEDKALFFLEKSGYIPLGTE